MRRCILSCGVQQTVSAVCLRCKAFSPPPAFPQRRPAVTRIAGFALGHRPVRASVPVPITCRAPAESAMPRGVSLSATQKELDGTPSLV